MKKFIFFHLLFVLMFASLVGYSQALMRVHPGTNLTIEDGYHIDVGSGNFLLMDDYTENPSFLQKGILSFSGGGESFVEQYSTRDVWHMVSSPMSDEFNEVYLWKYLERYHEPDNTWEFLNLPLDILLYAGEGLFMYNYTVDPNGMWPSSGDSVVFKGTLNSVDVNLTLSNTDASTMSGWNILGNPFPVTIEWNDHADWNLVNVEPKMWVFNSVTSSYEMYNWFTGTGTHPNNGFIAATQGFWVHAEDTTGVPTSLTIPASQRSHTNAEFLKSEVAMDNQLLLNVKDDKSTLADNTIIGFVEEATADYDAWYDGFYFPSVEGAISLYTKTRGQKYLMNELPSYEDHPMIPLYFISPFESSFTLTAGQIASFSPEVPIYLEDRMLNVYQDLRKNNTYQFNCSTEDMADRFVIHFANPAAYQDLFGSIEIYGFNDKVYINIPFEVNGAVNIFDITGRKVYEDIAKSGSTIIEASVDKGHYIVQLLLEEGVKTEKLYIN